MPVLKGTKTFYQYEITDIVASNVKSWLDYGLLETGAYYNVGSGSKYFNLQRVSDPRYGDNKVFEGFGSWVWESGVSTNSVIPLPVQVSGIWANGSFYFTNATTSGYPNHKIDYETGRVIFNEDVPTSTNIQCNYSTRAVAVYLSDSPQWRTVVDDFVKRYDTIDSLSPSGIAEILKENRVWTPCIVVETLDITNDGLQLGGGELSSCSVLYHIFSDKAFSAKKLSDLIVVQDEKVLRLFDVNKIPGFYNYDGTLPSGVKTYKNIVDDGQYFWTFGHITNTNGGFIDNSSSLYRAEVRHTIEVERYLSTY